MAPASAKAQYPCMTRELPRFDLTSTLQRVRVPCFVADADGTITWLNDAAKSIFGDLEGRSFTTFVVP
jgi:PAS fold